MAFHGVFHGLTLTFHAALVLGPHGAQHANMVYSREEAAII